MIYASPPGSPACLSEIIKVSGRVVRENRIKFAIIYKILPELLNAKRAPSNFGERGPSSNNGVPLPQNKGWMRKTDTIRGQLILKTNRYILIVTFPQMERGVMIAIKIR